ncbi:MAG TPA: hypothetical protein VFZ63_14420 [Jiangellaceae bacterium]
MDEPLVDEPSLEELAEESAEPFDDVLADTLLELLLEPFAAARLSVR